MNIDQSNFATCLARIAARGGRTAAEARRILGEVHDRGADLVAEGAADPYVQAAQELAERARQAARQQRLDALRNATVRAGIMDAVEKEGGIATAADTLRSLLHGTNSGARDSVEARWRGNAATWQAALSWALRKAGVEKAAISGEMDREISREMWGLNAGAPSEATKNSPARQAAEAMAKMLDHLRERLNGAGARIGDAVDYVTHTNHDPDKLRAAAGSRRAPIAEAFGQWWHDTEPLLAEKTFADVTPAEGESVDQARRRFGQSVFEALVSGIHMTEGPAFGAKGFVKGGVPYVPPAFEGAGNLARRLSEGRVLFWRDGASWHEYMAKYGAQSSLAQGVMRSIDRAARKLALMQKLGTNPAGNLALVIRRLEETYRGDPDALQKFQNKIDGLDAVMAHLDGSANIPANAMAARIGSSVRSWETMSDLGGVGITHFASIWPTVTSEMKHHGFTGAGGRLAVMGNLVKALARGKGSAERQELLADLGAYSRGLTRDMWARWQAEQPIAGWLSSMANTFMKYTGIHYVFDNTQAAIREMLAAQLGRRLSGEYAALEPHLQQMLGKYGIGPGEWELLRSVEPTAAEGRRYLTPSDALKLDSAAAAKYLGESAANDPERLPYAASALARDLSDKLAAYYGDAAAHAVVTPGIKERAMLLGKERPGSFGGELRRFLVQFKMWPVAAANQILGREIHMSLSKGDAAWGLGTLMALTAAGGYLRMAVNDVALGHPLRDPRDPRTLLAALAQGGGVGILGDFLFGEAMRNRFGSGVVGTLGGPAVSDVDSFIHIYNDWLHGKAGWPDLARFMVRHIPFANLVYVKGALDYLLWFHLYEAASPGWWERANRRQMKETGRAMLGYKAGAPIPWTPWGVGAT
jgi:hypothetical protein